MSNQISNQYEMKGQYTPENSALVLIDHQVGTLTFEIINGCECHPFRN